MTIQNPPGWIQALSTHTAAQLRTYLASFQAGGFPDNTSLRARGGVHPTLGNHFLVAQAGSPNMTVIVSSGVCSIPGSENSLQGNYIAVNDAPVTLSISAAHASLARIDIVVVNVRDAQYSGVSNDVQLQVITGTPASSPAVPTAPANSITIAQIAVGAGVTSIVTANITDTRDYMTATGGVMQIRNLAAAPSSSIIQEGQLLWAMDTNTLYLHDGSANNQVYPHAVTQFVRKTADETINNSASQQDDDHLTLPIAANTTYTFEVYCSINVFSANGWKAGFSFPSSPTEVSWMQFGPLANGDGGNSSGSQQAHWTSGALGQTSSPASSAANTGGLSQGTAFDTWHWIKGHIINGANAGNLRLRWAMNAASGNNLIVRTNSWMEVRRIG